jgi:two-component system, OmpR family, phosphate regulon response regulator PhoB
MPPAFKVELSEFGSSDCQRSQIAVSRSVLTMKTSPTKILLIQGGLGDSVQPALERSGYRVIWVRAVRNALERVKAEAISLVIVDTPSLRVSTERLCQAIKRIRDVPVMLIGDDGEADPGTSADAFLPRPLQLKRLLARVEKLMPEGQSTELKCGEISFRPNDGIVRRRGVDHYLNPKLSKLLLTFMHRQGEVIPRKYLMQAIWETSYMGDTRTLDVHIRWLREKIEDDASQPTYLLTVRGQGYRFDNPKPKGK